MPLITLRDGSSLHVRVHGRGEPVLVLSGLAMSGRHWLPLLLPFLTRYRFFIPDFRGVGKSAHAGPAQKDVFQSHMEDAQDVVAHFGLRDFRLIGYSLGASTALHWQRAVGFAGVRRYLHIDQTPSIPNGSDWPYGLFGERQPERFARLQSAIALLEQHPRARHVADLPAAARRRLLDITGAIFGEVLGQPLLHPLLLAAARWPILLEALPLMRVRDLHAHLHSFVHAHDYRESLRRCATPITVMVGMRSPLYAPAGQAAIADYAPDCRVVPFAASGHMPMFSEPRKFLGELGRFLRA